MPLLLLNEDQQSNVKATANSIKHHVIKFVYNTSIQSMQSVYWPESDHQTPQLCPSVALYPVQSSSLAANRHQHITHCTKFYYFTAAREPYHIILHNISKYLWPLLL